MTTEQKQTALVELTKLSSRVESLKLRRARGRRRHRRRDRCPVHRRLAGRHHPRRPRLDAAVRPARGRRRRPLPTRRRRPRRGPGQRRPSPRHRHRARRPATDLDPELRIRGEQHLVEQADQFGPRELRRLGARLLEAIAPDIADQAEYERLVAEERRAHAATQLTFRPRGDGSTDLSARLPDHVAHRLRTYLDSFTSPRRAALDTALGEVDQLPGRPPTRRGVLRTPGEPARHRPAPPRRHRHQRDGHPRLRHPPQRHRSRHHLHRRPDHRRTSPTARLQRPADPRRPRQQGRDPRPRPHRPPLLNGPTARPWPPRPPNAPRTDARSPPPGAKHTTEEALVPRRPHRPRRRQAALLLPPPPRPRPRLERCTTTPTATPPSPGGREGHRRADFAGRPFLHKLIGRTVVVVERTGSWEPRPSE